MDKDYDEQTITREEFEREFNVIPPGEAQYIIVNGVYGYRSVKFVFIGWKHKQIQELEKLWKLKEPNSAEI